MYGCIDKLILHAYIELHNRKLYVFQVSLLKLNPILKLYLTWIWLASLPEANLNLAWCRGGGV